MNVDPRQIGHNLSLLQSWETKENTGNTSTEYFSFYEALINFFFMFRRGYFNNCVIIVYVYGNIFCIFVGIKNSNNNGVYFKDPVLLSLEKEKKI